MAGLDHVNIASPDAAGLAARFRDLLGLHVERETTVEDQGVKVFLLSAGAVKVEITEPLGPETPVASFLRKRGPGLHHLAFEVDDVAATLEKLKDAGVPLVDEEPRIGAEGHRIAFVHPKAFGGVLVEIVESGAHKEG